VRGGRKRCFFFFKKEEKGGGPGGGGGGGGEQKNKAMFLKDGKLPDQSSEFLNKDSVPWGYFIN